MRSSQGAAANPGNPSPIELLHPAGMAASWTSYGSSALGGLAPPRPESDGASAGDLLLLSPSRSERLDGAWIAAAAERAGRVAADGLVAALRPSRALVRALTDDGGLTEVVRLMHLPDLERSRFVFPLRGAEARYALQALVPLSRPKRAAARLMGYPPMSVLAPISVVFRRPGASPLGSWLAQIALPAPQCTMALTRSWRPGGAAVAARFTGGPAPDLIAKIGAAGPAEAERLRLVSSGAHRAGIAIPRLLAESVLAERPVVAETAVLGRPAALVVNGSADRAERHLLELGRSLVAWQRGERPPAEARGG